MQHHTKSSRRIKSARCRSHPSGKAGHLSNKLDYYIALGLTSCEGHSSERLDQGGLYPWHGIDTLPAGVTGWTPPVEIWGMSVKKVQSKYKYSGNDDDNDDDENKIRVLAADIDVIYSTLVLIQSRMSDTFCIVVKDCSSTATVRCAIDLMGDFVVKSAMGKSFDAFRKILREQKLDAYFWDSRFGKYLDLPEDNNARFQIKMVIPILTQKVPHTPKKGKDKSCDLADLVSIIGPSFKNKNLIEALKGKELSKKHKQPLCLVRFVHNIHWARDINNNISVGLIKLSEDLEVFNNYPWGYESFKMIVQYLLTLLAPKTVNLYGFPWAFMGGLVVVVGLSGDGAIGGGSGVAIGANNAPVIELTSKRGVIPSKRILFLSTPLDIKAKRREVISKALSSIQKRKIAIPLSVCCTEKCTISKQEHYELNKVDVEATTKKH
ncbi:hypothetical protein BC332_10829 [Capsicum chinense]|nr:hypothetical protein BC332_10829 [Capsicum chinense]